MTSTTAVPEELERLDELRARFEEQGGDFLSLAEAVDARTDHPDFIDPVMEEDDIRTMVDVLEDILE